MNISEYTTLVPDLEKPTDLEKFLDLQILADLRPTILIDPHPQTGFIELN